MIPGSILEAQGPKQGGAEVSDNVLWGQSYSRLLDLEGLSSPVNSISDPPSGMESQGKTFIQSPLPPLVKGSAQVPEPSF